MKQLLIMLSALIIAGCSPKQTRASPPIVMPVNEADRTLVLYPEFKRFSLSRINPHTVAGDIAAEDIMSGLSVFVKVRLIHVQHLLFAFDSLRSLINKKAPHWDLRGLNFGLHTWDEPLGKEGAAHGSLTLTLQI